MTADRPSYEVAPCAHAIIAVLRQEQTLLRALLDSIELELQALRENDAPALEAAAERKYQHTQGLAELDRQRRELLAKASLTTSAAGIEHLIRECEPGQQRQLQHAWEELLSLTRRCYEGNARNGQLNVVAQRMLRQMLAHLRGESTNPDVYDRDGRVAAYDPKDLGRV